MIRFSLLTGVFLFATYMVLAGQISETEIIASTLATFIACVFTVAHRRNARRRFSAPQGVAGFILHSIVQIVPNTCRVAWALLRVVSFGARASRGSIAEQPFSTGTSSPRDATRRAITTLGVSFAPNGYVLRVFAADGSLVVHRLVPAGISSNREWPS